MQSEAIDRVKVARNDLDGLIVRMESGGSLATHELPAIDRVIGQLANLGMDLRASHG